MVAPITLVQELNLLDSRDAFNYLLLPSLLGWRPCKTDTTRLPACSMRDSFLPQLSHKQAGHAVAPSKCLHKKLSGFTTS